MIEHGTINRYQHYGCRCDECAPVGRAYTRERVSARKLLLDSLPSHYHGKRSTYSNWGCRRESCVAANREYLCSWRRR